MKHVPEPLSFEINEDGSEFTIFSPYKDDDDIVLSGFFTNHTKKNHKETISRIVGCYNALEGIENPKEWVKQMKDYKKRVKDAFDYHFLGLIPNKDVKEFNILNSVLKTIEHGIDDPFETITT